MAMISSCLSKSEQQTNQIRQIQSTLRILIQSFIFNFLFSLVRTVLLVDALPETGTTLYNDQWGEGRFNTTFSPTSEPMPAPWRVPQRSPIRNSVLILIQSSQDLCIDLNKLSQHSTFQKTYGLNLQLSATVFSSVVPSKDIF